MPSEIASYAQWFDQGNFRANKRWNKEFKPLGKVDLIVPKNIAQRKNNSEPFVSYGQSMEFGRFEAYQPPREPLLDPEVRVARSPLYPLQRIAGPIPFVKNIMFAYYLLDKLHPKNPFHHMDIIASVRVDGDGVLKNNKKLLLTNNLLKFLGIDLDETRFCIDRDEQDQPNVYGITCDKDWPTFFLSHDVRLGGKSSIISSIVYAENIVHDWTHREQERLGYSSSKKAAEIQALSNQLRIGEALFNHPGFFRPDPFTGWKPDRITEDYSTYFKQIIAGLESFKQGGFGHLLETPGWEKDDLDWYRKEEEEEFLPIDSFC